MTPVNLGACGSPTSPKKFSVNSASEPLEKDFTARWLFENLHTRKRQLKPLLLDQSFIAGLGNIYTDECLHIAKLHPLALSNTVKLEQAEALHKAIRAVLKKAFAATVPA
ncbi:MAG: hypothetical protein IPO36_18720 [Anaerolineales bacterium]|nr:hypothetical protein [Anaerolineales bacterium]